MSEVNSSVGVVREPPAPALPDDAPRVVVRPSLNRDLAALMTLLFVIVTYHIQHPTLLFRAQFGRSFRDEGLQEGVVIMLMISVLFLLGSWRNLLDGLSHAAGRLTFAFAIVLGAFTLHGLLMIYGNTNLFHSLYNASATVLEDFYREADLLPMMKAGNSAAILGGAALISLICLWSPWERPKVYQNGFKLTELLYDVAALLSLGLIFITYHLQNPLLLATTSLGKQFDSESAQFVTGLFLLTTSLLVFAPNLRGEIRPVKFAMLAVLGLYIFHILNVLLGNDNVFMNYYNVSPESYQAIIEGDSSITNAYLALDRAALLAGMALMAVLFVWSPWERLALYNEAIQSNIVPLGIALVVLTLWEGIIEVFDIQQFLLPRPSVIWGTLLEEYPKMIAAGWFTFLNAFKGFLIGCGAGIVTGIFSARFTKFSTAVLPLAIAANAVPIIAFAPITNIWFGVTEPASKIAIVAIMTYFPAMISTVRGLTSVDKTQLELMRTYAATELEMFQKLRVPTALPFIFSALKLATTLSMIGALVSEFFGGSLAGLGYRIREDAALFRFPESWSAIIVASLFGISFYLLISALERAAMPWYLSFRRQS